MAIGLAAGVRVWNALAGPVMWGYDAWGHVAYVLFLDLYRGVPWADQGWSYFHPPLHYALGWVLAQLGSAEALMRGLALWSSAASLATAGLAAWLLRGVSPGRPGLALVAFAAVAFLPVHLFVSPMPGNEMTLGLLTALALVSFVVNQRRPRPTPARDVWTGVLLGLALLTKFSGLVPLACVVFCILTAPLWRADPSSTPLRAALRAGLVSAVALALAGPFYVRNVVAFGTPFQLSRDFPLVAEVERDQPPGSRGWLDYARFPSRAFSDPDPRAPHLLHAVWPSAYVNVWADVTRESDVAPTPASRQRERRVSRRMVMLGLGPTLLFLAGVLFAARDVGRGRRRASYLPLLVLCAGVIGAFATFAWRVPQWSALKAAYLLGLSLGWGVFTARGLEALARARWLRGAALACLLLAWAGAAVTGLEGMLLARRADAPAAGAVHFYFGEYEEARRIYARLATASGYPVPWLESLAAVELAEGHPERAVRLSRRAAALAGQAGQRDAQRDGRLAVCLALADDAPSALQLLAEPARGELPAELLANRGAIRAARGDLEAAERDLVAALELEPELVPAWRNLARVHEQAGAREAARRVRAQAADRACRAPRRYPYGLGTGEILEWGVGRRPLLLWEEDGLRVALPAFYGDACTRLRERG